MRTRTPVVALLAAAIGAVVCRRGLARIASSTFAGGLALAGYGPFTECDSIAQQHLLNCVAKRWNDIRPRAAECSSGCSRTKAESTGHRGEKERRCSMPDRLGRRGLGAFGAGFLKGWHKVPAQHPLAKPEFDIVSGVSTVHHDHDVAFLGDEPARDQIVTLYRNQGRRC